MASGPVRAGQAYVELNLRDRFTRGLRGISRSVTRLGRTVAGVSTRIAALGATAAAGLAAAAIKLAAEAERTRISFEVMLGSAEAAEKVIKQINNLSIETPFTPVELQKSAQTLLGFGRTMDEVIDDLRMLGDLSQGNGQILRQLALVYGQVAGLGRLQGQDALQLINAQIPVWKLLAESMGLTVAEVRKLSEAGNVSFEDLRRALQRATSEGGAFYQMSQRQSQTLIGLWSTLVGKVQLFGQEIGKRLTATLQLKEGLQAVIEALDQITIEDVVANVTEALAMMSKQLETVVFLADALQQLFRDALISIKGVDRIFSNPFYRTLLTAGQGPLGLLNADFSGRRRQRLTSEQSGLVVRRQQTSANLQQFLPAIRTLTRNLEASAETQQRLADLNRRVDQLTAQQQSLLQQQINVTGGGFAAVVDALENFDFNLGVAGSPGAR